MFSFGILVAIKEARTAQEAIDAGTVERSWRSIESAGIIVTTVERGIVSVLLFQRSMDASRWPGCWQIPAGRQEANESMDEAIKRELLEEVSHAPSNPILVGLLNQDGSKAKATYWAEVDPEEALLFQHNNPASRVVEGMAVQFWPIDAVTEWSNDLLTPGTAHILKTYGSAIKAHSLSHTTPTAADLGLLTPR